MHTTTPCSATTLRTSAKPPLTRLSPPAGSISSHNGHAEALNASNGQACYWFSNGCTIGCDKCDGSSNHVSHGNQAFLYKGMSAETIRARKIVIDNPWNPAPGDMVLNRSTTKGLVARPNCANPTTNATICDSRLRTANTQAECGSPDDGRPPLRHPLVRTRPAALTTV